MVEFTLGQKPSEVSQAQSKVSSVTAREMVEADLVKKKIMLGDTSLNKGKERALFVRRNFLLDQASKQMETQGKVDEALQNKLFDADVELESYLESKYSGAKGFFLKMGEKVLEVSKKLGELGVKSGKGLVKAGAELEEKKKKERLAHPEAPTAVERFTGSSGSAWRKPVIPLEGMAKTSVHSTMPYSNSARNSNLWGLR